MSWISDLWPTFSALNASLPVLCKSTKQMRKLLSEIECFAPSILDSSIFRSRLLFLYLLINAIIPRCFYPCECEGGHRARQAAAVWLSTAWFRWSSSRVVQIKSPCPLIRERGSKDHKKDIGEYWDLLVNREIGNWLCFLSPLAIWHNIFLFSKDRVHRGLRLHK